MNTKIITAIALKLFAIYVVVAAILAMPTIAGSFIIMKRQPIGSEASIILPIIIAFVTILVLFIAFQILWDLGNKTLKNVSEINKTDDNFDILAFEEALFVLLGVYFSVSAVVDLPNLASSFWALSHTPTGITITDYAWLISLVAQLLIGLSLIKNLDKWLLLVRNIGVK